MDKKKQQKKSDFQHVGIYSFVALVVVFLGLPIISLFMPIVVATFGTIGLIKFAELSLVDRTFLILTWLMLVLFLYIIVNPSVCCAI